jgi:hypothetical protein
VSREAEGSNRRDAGRPERHLSGTVLQSRDLRFAHEHAPAIGSAVRFAIPIRKAPASMVLSSKSCEKGMKGT